MIHEVGNVELCEFLETNPKHSAKYVYHIGRRHRLLHVRALHAKRNEGEQEICPVHHGSPLDSELLFKERTTPRAPLWEEARRLFVANSFKKKCKKINFLGIHDRFIRDEKFRKNMFDVGRFEEMFRKMDELANEDHTHHLTPDVIREKKVGSDTMPVRHRPDFKQALSPCDSSKTKRMQLISRDCKVILHLGGTGKNPEWHSSFEHHHEDGPSTD